MLTLSLFTVGLVQAQAVNSNPSGSTPQATVSPQTPAAGSPGSETGLVKCGVSRDCTICDLFILARDIFTLALQLLAALAVMSMVIGGIYMLVSAGNPTIYGQGVDIITNAVIGLLLVMASFLLFSFLLVGLGFQSQNFSQVLTFQSGRLFEIKCDNSSTFGGQPLGGSATGPDGSGNVGSLNVSCIASSNISDEVSAILRTISLYEGVATQRGYATTQGYCYYHNLSGTPVHPRRVCDRSDAFGKYQMLSTTWVGWAARAGVPRVGSDYNIAPVYQDAAVAKFLADENIATCRSFAASAGNSGTYGKACQWTSIPGCATQPNDTTRKYPDAVAVCNKLLEDEKTGACK